MVILKLTLTFFVDMQASQNFRKSCTSAEKRLELDLNSLQLDFDNNNSCDNSSVESSNSQRDNQHNNQDQQTNKTSALLHSQQTTSNQISNNLPGSDAKIPKLWYHPAGKKKRKAKPHNFNAKCTKNVEFYKLKIDE